MSRPRWNCACCPMRADLAVEPRRLRGQLERWTIPSPLGCLNSACWAWQHDAPHPLFGLLRGRGVRAAARVFSATAARMSVFNAFSSILSPSWMSMARLALPPRLELKRPEGSSNDAPLTKVIFTTSLYVSPVQIIPACDHTGTPLHFHSSTTSGSACLMRSRTRASVSPRQSLSSPILPSISREGELVPSPSLEPLFIFFMVVARPSLVSPAGTWYHEEARIQVIGKHQSLPGASPRAQSRGSARRPARDGRTHTAAAARIP